MDLVIYKGNRFYNNGCFDIKIHQKEQNLYAYIPQKAIIENTQSKIMCEMSSNGTSNIILKNSCFYNCKINFSTDLEIEDSGSTVYLNFILLSHILPGINV